MSGEQTSPEQPLEEAQLHDQINQGPSEVVQLLPTIPADDSELAKTAVELANHLGGSLFVGVNDDGEPTDVADINRVEREAATILEDYIEGDFRYYTFTYDIDNSGILEVRVKKYETLPCAVDGRFYRWKPVISRPLSPQEVSELMTDFFDN